MAFSDSSLVAQQRCQTKAWSHNSLVGRGYQVLNYFKQLELPADGALDDPGQSRLPPQPLSASNSYRLNLAPPEP